MSLLRQSAGLLLLILAVAAASSGAAGAAETPALDYTGDVRPILAEACFHCHGQDSSHREAELRLDQFESSSDGDVHGAELVVSPGNPAESELIARITSTDPEVRMPPAASGKSLEPEQIDTLRRWVAEGAKYQKHWAFVAPERPAVPTVKDTAWIRNPIDAFVLARLEREGVRPSPPAKRNALLRRLSLDLVGLPPSVEEVDAYEAVAAGAARPQAYGDAVERLLASPHFGERWGRLWLDAARYADSDGFEKDKSRDVWMYRDWVIEALNADLPYDQFIVQQLAGDMLADAAQDEQVATGFLRNSMVNEEGGIDPEQFRMEALYDRMDAIGKSVLGITIQCAQCHTHKYDPIEHVDYYRLFAFINNCDESQISAFADQELAEWQETEKVIRKIENELKAANPDWRQRMAAWEKANPADPTPWEIVRPQLDASGSQKHYLLDDGSVLAAGYAPTQHTTDFTVEIKSPKVTAVRLELLNDPNLPRGGPGRSIYGGCALTEFQVTATPTNDPAKPIELKFAAATADVNPPHRPLGAAFDDKSGTARVTGPIQYANDGDNLTAWTSDDGPIGSNVPRQAVFTLDKPLDAAAGMRLTFKLVQNHGGWNSDDNQNNNLGRFRFAVTGADGAKADAVPSAVRQIMAIPAEQRTAEQVAAVFNVWRKTIVDWAETNRRLDALYESHPRGTTQLVLHERTNPRKTHRLDRGDFLKPAEEVTPGVPSFLHPLAARGAAPDRLDFARWLVDRRSPTTARAIVNRIWQAYFGQGLMTTPEDFGTQGALPSHPELLDWLAVELMDNGWSLKHIHRLIVSSATYQQSAVVSSELLARDPSNVLLARGARYRVDAEVVRDIALATSGLLTRTIGGPSVYPPAPEFLFEPPTSYGPKIWNYDTGPDKYRRALYTFRFRSVPYPALETFDAPKGEVSCVRRTRSNTPLQALTTLNETLYLECARALAGEIVARGGASDAQRLTYAVRRTLSRNPEVDELETLGAFLTRQKERFETAGVDPWPLIAEGDNRPAALPGNVAPPELAAWTSLARVVLNLDEAITKE